MKKSITPLKFVASSLQRFLCLILMLTFATHLHSQTLIKVSGTVMDGESNKPLVGVSAGVKGGNITTATDANGNYTLNVNGNVTLVFSYIGYTTQEIKVSGKNIINIALRVNQTNLTDVIVVGYGSQVKKAVTGAVQTINTKDIKDIPVSQITEKLQGRLAGVQINQTTGKPGQGMSVRIRGQLSVSAGSDPLYVVDGFPITGNIGAINPDEIESISILKDAASTSLYGSRAANGVVLITTKKGKKGQTNVSFNTFAGIQQVPEKGRVQMMDAVEFAQFKKEYYEDAGKPVPV
jgi:TonB-dependent SusC/RagA subfamily outer membrane receptor